MISEPIRRVAIIGGCHGNERSGVYFVKCFEKILTC